MVDQLKHALHELWAPSRYTIPINQGQLVQARLTDGAFILRDAPAKSSPAPTIGAASRIGIVSPGPLQDLAATAEVPAAYEDEILPVPAERKKSRGSKDVGDGGVVKGISESLAGTDEAGSDEEIRSLRKGNETGRDDAHGRAAVASPKRSLGYGRGALPLVAAGGSAMPSDKIGEEQPSTPSSAHKRRLVHEREGTVQHSTGAEETIVGADADEGAGETGKEGGAEYLGSQDSRASRARSPKRQGGGATEVGGSQCDETSNAGAGTNSSPFEVTNASAASAAAARTEVGGASAAPLAFNMQGILAGCRKASRLKRKRDARNASASSFSGKLSGRASADDQDSKAAARAFSRVLHKVGGVVAVHAWFNLMPGFYSTFWQ